jgi:hypothetical protein
MPGSGDRERRKTERRRITATVTLRHGGGATVLDVENISAGGILLRLAVAQRPVAGLGEGVTVYFDVGPDAYGDPLDLEVDAEVVRIDLGGPQRPATIALMWTSMDPAVPQRLALVLEHLENR